MRRQSRLVTITALFACGPTHEPTSNPPELPPTETPEPTPEPEPEPEPEPRAERPRPKQLNSLNEDGKVIYANRDGGCFIHLPFPDGERPPPGKRPPTQAVTCPPEMTATVWKECSGGTIWTARSGEGCECRIMSNPPPAPRPIDCPE